MQLFLLICSIGFFLGGMWLFFSDEKARIDSHEAYKLMWLYFGMLLVISMLLCTAWFSLKANF